MDRLQKCKANEMILLTPYAENVYAIITNFITDVLQQRVLHYNVIWTVSHFIIYVIIIAETLSSCESYKRTCSRTVKTKTVVAC